MRYNRFAAPIMAGMLTLTLGLVGCGGNNSSAASTATSTASTAESTAEATSAASTAEATSAASTAEATSAASTEATTEATDEILFWAGETDKGDSLMYSEDDENDTASIILFGDHDGNTELLAYSGAVTAEDGNLTIVDSETGDQFTFALVEVTEQGITLDLGEHGKGTIVPVTSSEFEAEVDNILSTITAVGEELQSLQEQDVEELLSILSFVLELQ